MREDEQWNFGGSLEKGGMMVTVWVAPVCGPNPRAAAAAAAAAHTCALSGSTSDIFPPKVIWNTADKRLKMRDSLLKAVCAFGVFSSNTLQTRPLPKLEILPRAKKQRRRRRRRSADLPLSVMGQVGLHTKLQTGEHVIIKQQPIEKYIIPVL